ncbi:MAG: 3-hydroxyacyl-CoA dehydrogenase NAD-binding domain-containing protein [Rhodospirillales bacterium]|nr:3-hydroxyacyl-CoA dehydrogenase NAD-binding domain-containing protein [Rhodospirillales bacterium]MDE0379179.1 3-hydroxyacyl-CoA dehydrogenase NAD-binding domain-containing protein [Rhodospirillales bacterium]
MGGAGLERDGAVGIITIDNPPVNAMSPGLPGAILARLAEAQADDAVEAVVLRGAGKGALAGADIRSFGTPWPEGEPTLRDVIAAIELSAKPVIATLAGYWLGGGLELALSCHYRVASRKTQVGQPEVALGFPPGAGGTQRLPRLAGVEAALAMIVDGTPVDAPEAAEKGILDRVIDGDLLEGAVAFAGERIAAGPPHALARERTPELRDPDIFAATRERLERRARGQRAPLACLECVELALEVPFDEGIRRERAIFEACMASAESRALRHVFFAERAVRKVPGIGKETSVRPIESAAIVGAGTMGRGIATCFANAGISVRLMDSDSQALEHAMAGIRSEYEGRVKRGRIAAADAEDRIGLIEPIETLERVAGADLVIEAVFEEMPLKEEVFRALDAVCDEGAIIASNTSYLDVNHLADIVPRRRGNVLGMHFFSPAQVMRLLEVVRTDSATLEALASVLALAKRLGKLAVVAGVCHGFIGNRMLEGYTREVRFLLEEGASPVEIDAALTAFGMAMGPCSVADLAGLDVSWRKRKADAHLRDPAKRYSAVADRLCELGRFGQKTGAGYYRYEPGSRAPVPDPEVDALIAEVAAESGIERRAIAADEIVERCLYPLVNEGARILDEGIALRASDIDIVWINGYGFPRWRGGVMHWADEVGLDAVHATIARLDESGDHWEPAPLLSRLASEGKGFADVDRAA